MRNVKRKKRNRKSIQKWPKSKNQCEAGPCVGTACRKFGGDVKIRLMLFDGGLRGQMGARQKDIERLLVKYLKWLLDL